MDLDKLRDLIIKHEGIKNKPYTDTQGKLSIGVGRNLTDKGLAFDEIMTLLDHDIAEAVEFAMEFPWWNSLSENRQIVVVSMIFNIGLKGFKTFKDLITNIGNEDWGRAAGSMLQSKWRTQVGARATELAAMMLKG